MKGAKTVISVPVTTYKTEESVTITGITMDDAKALLAVLRKVGGEPMGPRGSIDRFIRALYQAGVELKLDNRGVLPTEFPTLSGNIHF